MTWSSGRQPRADGEGAFKAADRDTGADGSRPPPLVWIAKNYAINPTHIVLVFHGNDGHVEISFVDGNSKSIPDRELSDEGRALLLPPAPGARA